jgi:hypothetical protein
VTRDDPMASSSPTPGPAPRPPLVVWFGLAVVLAAAAVLSFDALRSLGLAVGIPGHLAWLLPVAVDAGAAVSCATWLGRRATPDAARYAGRMTWSLLAVTVLGNAGQLGMHAHGITPPWWVAVLVGAIPPAVVGSTVHLVVLLVRASPHVATPGATDVPDDVEPEVIQAIRNGAGRRKLVALGLTDHRAKQLIATHRHTATGCTTTHHTGH